MFSDIDPINVDFTSIDFSESLGMDSFNTGGIFDVYLNRGPNDRDTAGDWQP